VGLVLVPRTARSFLPLNFPPIIRNTVSLRKRNRSGVQGSEVQG
jgi:hypothetical protein